MARQIGLSSQPISRQLPVFWAQRPAPWILARGDTALGPAFSAASWSERQRYQNEWLPALDLRPSRDGEWMVFGRRPLEELTNMSGPVEAHSTQELKAAKWRDPAASGQSGLMTLREWLAAGVPANLVLIVHSRERAAVLNLIEVIDKLPEATTLLMLSPYATATRVLRKERPSWFMANDPADFSRLRLLTAVGLETVAQMEFDFLLVPEVLGQVGPLPERLKLEVLRRKKPILLEWDGKMILDAAAISNVTGVLTFEPRRVAVAPQ